jgi:hypothetical protein
MIFDLGPEKCTILGPTLSPGQDDGERSESHKMALGHPLEEPLKIYPVSDLVNSPKTDDARCIEPVRIDRDFFERNGGGMKGKAENVKILGPTLSRYVIWWRRSRGPLHRGNYGDFD